MKKNIIICVNGFLFAIILYLIYLAKIDMEHFDLPVYDYAGSSERVTKFLKPAYLNRLLNTEEVHHFYVMDEYDSIYLGTNLGEFDSTNCVQCEIPVEKALDFFGVIQPEDSRFSLFFESASWSEKSFFCRENKGHSYLFWLNEKKKLFVARHSKVMKEKNCK
jgi:hypothetical protein